MIRCYRLGDDGDKEWLCEHESDEITCEEKDNGDLVLTLPHKVVELLINRIVLDALKDYISTENL